ncbi:MAG: GNAT family N-acetyltransferase [Anaerolineaceae bacterium]|nr:GNAT family N-acetyltransferase [Anaerolineaceae bacterium]
MTRLDGNRIYLRPHEMRDKAVIFAGSAEPEGGRLTGTQGTFTMAQIEAYIDRNSTDDSRAGWVICTLDDTVVGEVVINQIDTDNRSANIRIGMFDPQYFGKGYGTEAMRLALDYGFGVLRLHRISLGVYDFNPRAIHVYENKLGFRREGVLRDALLWDGDYHDEIIMSLLEHEWRGD